MNEHFFLGKLYLDCIQSNSQFYADAKASFQQEKKKQTIIHIKHDTMRSFHLFPFISKIGIKSFEKCNNRHFK